MFQPEAVGPQLPDMDLFEIRRNLRQKRSSENDRGEPWFARYKAKPSVDFFSFGLSCILLPRTITRRY